MSSFLVILLATAVVFALCLLGMAVGVIFRNRGFKSCGGSKICFRGIIIRCPGCSEEQDEEAGAASGSRHAR